MLTDSVLSHNENGGREYSYLILSDNRSNDPSFRCRNCTEIVVVFKSVSEPQSLAELFAFQFFCVRYHHSAYFFCVYVCLCLKPHAFYQITSVFQTFQRFCNFTNFKTISLKK